MDNKEQIAYRESQKRLWDNYAIAETQKTIGREQGREEGREEEKTETIKAALLQGLSASVVAAIARCEEAEVLRVKEEQNL